MKVMPEPAFKRLGKYEIHAELGRGGFGTVFRAFDPTVGRLVAIKVLMSEAGKDLVTRFRTEATAAGNLRHENIVTIYEFGDEKGVAFIAMEYLEGEDLQQVLASGKPLTLLEKISIMTQAAAGLDCAHRNGVVHRDVKPANIRLLPDGRIKIMDFGIARLVRDAGVARLTRRGHLLGTLLYMAPEQLMGSDTDALSDIFAYGVTFYELLTGRHPFQADDPRSVFYKITSEDPELIHDLAPDCPEMLDQVIRRALHKDRELRYQTLRDLRVDIEPVLIALRKERAASLATDAHRLADDRSFEQALALLNEAIDLDSANNAARQLRNSVQTELRRRLVRPRIESLLLKSDRFLEEGNHNEAIQALEAALQLESQDPELQARLREAQQRRDQTRESRRLVGEARADFAQGSLALALHKVSEALALNPKSDDAQSLLDLVRLELNKRERQQRLNETLRRARELLLLGSLNEAFGVMDTLEADDRDSPEALELLARIETQKSDLERRERLAEELAAADGLLDGGEFIRAVQMLQRLRSEFPDEPRVGRLLSLAQQKAAAFERAQAIERIQAEVLTCAEAKQFDDAVALLKSAMEGYPDDAGLLRLRDTVNLARSAWERQQAVEQTVRRCEVLADEDRFDEALVALCGTRQEYPDDTVLERLERRLETDRDKFRRAQAILSALQSANRLIGQRDPERAVMELEAALTELSDDRLRSALVHARQALAAKERAAKLDRLEREVALHLEKQEFDQAFRALDRASALAGEPALSRLYEETLSAKATWERGEAIAAAEQSAQALRAERRIDEAIAVVRECLERFPDASRLLRLEAGLREDRELQERAEAINAALTEARGLASRNDLSREIDVLRRAAARFPGTGEIDEALARAEDALRKRERERAIASITKEAEELAHDREFDRALELVDGAVSSWPGEPKIERLKSEIASAREVWLREQQIAAAMQRTLALCAESRFAEAVQVATDALRVFPGEDSLLAARNEASQQLERQERANRIRSAIQDAENLLSSGKPREAIECLNRVQSCYGTADEVGSVLTRAERALQEQMRVEAIARAASEANALTAHGRPSDAVIMLERAQAENGESPELDEALGRAREAIAAQRRDRALAEAADAVRVCLKSNDFDGALAAIDAAQQVSSADPRLDALRMEVSSAQAAWTAAQEIAAAVRECERLCAEGKYEEAFDAAESALKTYPGAKDVAAVQLKALAALDQQNRLVEIAECIAHAAELTSAGQPGRAAELIAAKRDRLGSDPAFEAALADAEGAIEARQRSEAIAAAVGRATDDAAKERFAEALAWLDSVESDWGPDASISATRESIIAARDLRDQQRETAERERVQRAEALRAVVREAVQKLTDLIDAGKVAEAGRALQKAMRDYPDEPELVAAQQRLKAESDRQRRSQATRRAAENAHALLAKGQAARAVELLEAAAAQYPDDPVILEALRQARQARGAGRKSDPVETVCAETKIYLDRNEFDRALKTVTVSLETHSGEPRLVALRETVIAARRDFDRNATRKIARSVAQAVTDDPSMSLPLCEPEASAEQLRSPPPMQSRAANRPASLERSRFRHGRKLVLACVACGCALAVALVGLWILRPKAAAAALTVETEPSGASVKIGDRSCVTPECRQDLRAGNYRVDATLPGYAAASEDVAIHKGEAVHVRLAMVPLPTSLVVTCNFPAGAVELDGASAGQMKDGQLTLDNLKPGRHQLRITSPGGEASVSFKTSVAQLPELTGDIVSRDAGALVATSFGASVRGGCSQCDGKPMLDGKPLQGQSLASGAHELTARMASGETQRLFFRTGEAPGIAIHLTSTVSAAGTLLVEANVDGASVSIDRRGVGRQTEGGRLVIPLEPRNYRVEIHKQGYRVSPDHLTAKIRKGDQFRAAFRLEPIPTTVLISGAAEGATVLIDGTSAGTIRGGSFSGAVALGAHTVSLAKEGFKTASAQRSFNAGETVRLDGAVLSLEPLPTPARQPAQPTAEELEAREWASVRSGHDRGALQAFLQKHPDSPHGKDAQQLLAQMEWDALDRKDRSALERFAARYGGSPLSEQANSEIAQIDRETTAVSNATAAAAKRTEEQAGADRDEILRVLSVYATAFEKKDLNLLKTVWPNMPEASLASLAQAFHAKGGIRSQLRLLAPAELAGDRATVRCIRVTEQSTQFGRQKPFEESRTVRLRRENGHWVISAID
jgi:serine/threonine-protein kinase